MPCASHKRFSAIKVRITSSPFEAGREALYHFRAADTSVSAETQISVCFPWFQELPLDCEGGLSNPERETPVCDQVPVREVKIALQQFCEGDGTSIMQHERVTGNSSVLQDDICSTDYFSKNTANIKYIMLYYSCWPGGVVELTALR